MFLINSLRSQKKIFWLLFFSVFSISAQSLSSLKGQIKDNNNMPISNAIIHLHETMQAAQSDSNGFFELKNLRKGHYHLHITLIGYESIEQHIDIPDSNFLHLKMKYSSLNLNEIVIESDPLHTSNIENSIRVEKVSEEYIQKNSSTTLMNSLEKLPGISVINMGVGISKPVIRGMSMSNVAVADNGIKQEGQQWGADHGLEIDQYSVDEVEIIKGPSSLMYGSDAIGGVISIRQPKILEQNKHTAKVQGILRTNNDTYGLTAGANGNYKGNMYRVRLTGLSYADYKVPANNFQYNRYNLELYDQRLKNTAGNEQHASIMLGVNRNWGFTHITLSNFNQNAGIFAGAAGIPRAYQLTNDGNFRNIDIPNQYINHFKAISNTSFRLGQSWIEMDLGFQNNLRQERSNPESFRNGVTPFANLALELRLNTFSANIRYIKNINEKLEGVYGVQSTVQSNQTNGYEYIIASYQSQQVGIYTLQKYKYNYRLNFNAGARYDLGYTNVNRGVVNYYNTDATLRETRIRTTAFDRTFHNYSLGLGASYLISNEINVKLNFGKSFRLPSAQELSANGFHHSTFRWEKGDSSLRPMSGYHYDIGLFYERKKWNARLTPFLNYFDNYIYSKASATYVNEIESGQLYVFAQTNAWLTGGEMVAEYLPTKSLKLMATGEYVYSYNIQTGLSLPFMPPLNVQTEAEYTIATMSKWLDNWYFRGTYAFYDSQLRVDRNERTTPGYDLFNVASGFTIKLKKKDFFTIHFQVQNVFDKRYMNHLSRYRLLNLPEPGRNYVVNIIFKI
ncbi:MAG: TonB-dependent receptor [Bacteroidota bacterium]|nr:TonB-dependent receptor [Bacteroidota bacterium]